MNWEEVSSLCKQNITFASHTHSHRYATELSESELLDDLKKSLAILNEKVDAGSISKIFCYPGGYYDSRSQETLSALNFKAAVAVHFKSDVLESPPIIGRIGIHEDICYSQNLFDYRVSWQSIN